MASTELDMKMTLLVDRYLNGVMCTVGTCFGTSCFHLVYLVVVVVVVLFNLVVIGPNSTSEKYQVTK